MAELIQQEYDCFISYSHDPHKPAVKAIYTLLCLSGVRVWVDFIHLDPGTLRDTTARAVQCSSAFLLMYSNQWFHSTYCRCELDDWQNSHPGKHPIIIKFGDVNPADDFPDDFYLDLSEVESWNKLFRGLSVRSAILSILKSLLSGPVQQIPLDELVQQNESLKAELSIEKQKSKYLVSSKEVREKMDQASAKLSNEIVEKGSETHYPIDETNLKPELKEIRDLAAPSYAARGREKLPVSFSALVTSYLMRDYEQTSRIAVELYEVEKANPDFFYYWGAALGNLERYSEAINKFTEAVRIDENRPEIWIAWGYVLVRLGLYDEALSKVEKAISLQEDDGEAHHLSAICYTELGQINIALEHFERAAELIPYSSSVYYNWAIAKSKLESFDEALQLFSTAAKAGTSMNISAAKAEVLFYAHRYDEAENEMHAALRFDKNLNSQAVPHLLFAAIYSAKRKPKEAAKELEFQRYLSKGGFELNHPERAFTALKAYKDEPAFKPFMEDIRRKLGLDDADGDAARLIPC